MAGTGEIQIIDPGWAWDDKLSYSQGMRSGEHLFVSGQLALDENGKLVGAGDMEAQARQVFRNMETILGGAGLGLDRVVKLTCFVTDFSDYAAYGRVRGEVFANRPPASSTVGTNALLVPGALLEVEAIARL